MDDAFQYCQNDLRENDRDRYLLGLFAPAPLRPSYWAILAFHLELARAESAVSEVMLGEMRLQWWRDGIQALFEGSPRQHHVVLALEQIRSSGAIRQEDLLDLIDRFEPVVTRREPTSMMEFEQFVCPLTEGLLRLLVGVQGQDLLETANPAIIGSARVWSIAAAIRAQPRLSGDRRLTIPMSFLQETNTSPEDIYRFRVTPETTLAFQKFTDIAQVSYAEVRNKVRLLPRNHRSPFLLTSIAAHHLRYFAKSGYNPFQAPAPASDGLLPLSLAWRRILGQV